MSIYMTQSARKRHSDRINQLVRAVAEVEDLGYTEAVEIVSYLRILQEQIDKEYVENENRDVYKVARFYMGVHLGEPDFKKFNLTWDDVSEIVDVLGYDVEETMEYTDKRGRYTIDVYLDCGDTED